MNSKTDLLQNNYVTEDELELLFCLPPSLGYREIAGVYPLPVLYNTRDRTQSLAHARQTLYPLIIPLAQIILYT